MKKIISFMMTVFVLFGALSEASPLVYSLKVQPSFSSGVSRTLNARGPLLIHIMDAHSSLDAQTNIANLIIDFFNQLLNKGHVPVLAVEGAFDEYTFSEIKKIPFKNELKKISYEYLKSGQLMGAEYATLLNKEDMSICGVEDEHLFKENYALFRLFAQHKEEAVAVLSCLELCLEQAKDLFLPEKIKTQYKEFNEYKQHPEENLILIGKIMETALKVGVVLEAYPMLQLLRDQMLTEMNYDNPLLDYGLLAGEVDLLAKEIMRKEAASERERKLLDSLFFMQLLEKILTLGASSIDLIDYNKLKDKGFSSLKIVELLKEYKLGYSLRQSDIRKLSTWSIRAEKFYSIVKKRDYAMINNLEKILLKQGAETAVLVTGGFHAENIERFAKERGFSYIQVSPFMSQNGKGVNYYSRLLAEADLNSSQVGHKYFTGALRAVSKVAFEQMKQNLSYDCLAASFFDRNGKLKGREEIKQNIKKMQSANFFPWRFAGKAMDVVCQEVLVENEKTGFVAADNISLREVIREYLKEEKTFSEYESGFADELKRQLYQRRKKIYGEGKVTPRKLKRLRKIRRKRKNTIGGDLLSDGFDRMDYYFWGVYKYHAMEFEGLNINNLINAIAEESGVNSPVFKEGSETENALLEKKLEWLNKSRLPFLMLERDSEFKTNPKYTRLYKDLCDASGVNVLGELSSQGFDELSLKKVGKRLKRYYLRYRYPEITPAHFKDVPWRLLMKTLKEEFHYAFNRDHLPRPVGVMGGARSKPDDHIYKVCEKLGNSLYDAGFAIITGAGPGGPMEGTLKALAEKKAPSLYRQGTKIDLPFEAVVNPYVGTHDDYERFPTRKRAFEENCQGMVVMPGGIGTWDEVWEYLSLGIPLVFFGKDHWGSVMEDVISFMDVRGYSIDGEKILITDSIDEVVRFARKSEFRGLKTGKEEQRKILKECEEGYDVIKGLLPAMVISGNIKKDTSHAQLGIDTIKWLIRNDLPVRLASNGDLFNAFLPMVNEENKSDFQACLLFRGEDGEKNKMEHKYKYSRKFSGYVSTTDLTVHHLLVEENALGYIFFPGDAGVVTSLMNILVSIQCGVLRPKPIYLVDSVFWKKILSNYMERAYNAPDGVRYISKKDFGLFKFADNPKELVEKIKSDYSKLSSISKVEDSSMSLAGKTQEMMNDVISRKRARFVCKQARNRLISILDYCNKKDVSMNAHITLVIDESEMSDGALSQIRLTADALAGLYKLDDYLKVKIIGMDAYRQDADKVHPGSVLMFIGTDKKGYQEFLSIKKRKHSYLLLSQDKYQRSFTLSVLAYILNELVMRQGKGIEVDPQYQFPGFDEKICTDIYEQLLNRISAEYVSESIRIAA